MDDADGVQIIPLTLEVMGLSTHALASIFSATTECATRIFAHRQRR
jgi:hypothetical protein